MNNQVTEPLQEHTINTRELLLIHSYLKTHQKGTARTMARLLEEKHPAAFRQAMLKEYDEHDNHLIKALKGGKDV